MLDITTEHIKNSNLIEGVTDPYEVIHSLRAWKYLRERGTINKGTILNLHYKIMVNLLPLTKVGRYRVIGEEVGIYQGYKLIRQCPSPLRVEALMDDWIKELQHYRESPKTMHVYFEHIHPFVDGNGRTGRMLMWWHEIHNGDEPTLIRIEEVKQYYKWFEGRNRVEDNV
jgi:cell filamentation protein, protein adenylyltransferase